MQDNNDELRVYRGSDYCINDNIIIYQPTLGEICDYGESKYYSMIYQLTATPQSMKFQLWDIGIDYTTITPWQLFYGYIYKLYSQSKTSILFGDLDFTKFQVMKNKNGDMYLYQKVSDTSRKGILSLISKKFIKSEQYVLDEDIIIDEYAYTLITDYIRSAHNLEKDEQIPANESTKMILIEDARNEYQMNLQKEYHSVLKNLISSMVNVEGFKYGHSEVWDMKINAFMDSVKRVSKIRNANLLLQSGYSGFGINLNKIDKKQLDWTGEL